jgi:hypothetical protein
MIFVHTYLYSWRWSVRHFPTGNIFLSHAHDYLIFTRGVSFKMSQWPENKKHVRRGPSLCTMHWTLFTYWNCKLKWNGFVFKAPIANIILPSWFQLEALSPALMYSNEKLNILNDPPLNADSSSAPTSFVHLHLLLYSTTKANCTTHYTHFKFKYKCVQCRIHSHSQKCWALLKFKIVSLY